MIDFYLRVDMDGIFTYPIQIHYESMNLYIHYESIYMDQIFNLDSFLVKI